MTRTSPPGWTTTTVGEACSIRNDLRLPISREERATTQTAIARYLDALREEIDLLGRSVSALKTQKRGLMQKLLTGQWRLLVQEEAKT